MNDSLRQGTTVLSGDLPFSGVSMRMRRVLVVALMVGLITAIGTSLQTYVQASMRIENPVSFFRVVRWPLIWWLFWVILTPAFFELGWRNQPTRQRWLKPTVVLIAGSLVAFVLHVALQVVAMSLPAYRMVHPTMGDAIRYHTVLSLYLNFFVYWCIVGSAMAIHEYSNVQQEALRAARLQTELARARLDGLRAQLHPHFLFNTLNGVSSLMYRDVGKADMMISKLSRLLRTALDRSKTDIITLSDEVDFLGEYIAVEKIRFGESLSVKFKIDPDAREFQVPGFVLQPLVENAIKHGYTNDQRLVITVGATYDSDNSSIQLWVEDDGIGVASTDGMISSGVGLTNLTDRLSRLFNDDYSLDICIPIEGGFRVDVVVPIVVSTHELAVDHIM
ncbi:MAG: histidine kinase [Rhodothermales bacterium]|nr:histidine kinase [Rhodothermales bacterium]